MFVIRIKGLMLSMFLAVIVLPIAHASDITERTVDVGDDLVFDVLEAGNMNNPAVIFLHGYPESMDTWRPLMEAVADAGYFAVAYNQRGYSIGTQPNQRFLSKRKREQYERDRYSIAEISADVDRIAEAVLNVDTFHIVGHDFGSVIAHYTAARLADNRTYRVTSFTGLAFPHAGAVLDSVNIAKCTTSTSNPEVCAQQEAFDSYTWIPLTIFKSPRRAKALGKFTDFFTFDDGFNVWEYINEPIKKEIKNTLASGDALYEASAWYRANPFDASLYSDDGPFYEIIRTPTLMLWGSDETYAMKSTVELNENYVDRNYQYELVVLEGSGHNLMHQNFLEVRDHLLTHLSENQ
ncbi:MAG: alpha/beta hydrolase [Pseudomonadota bacterium]